MLLQYLRIYKVFCIETYNPSKNVETKKFENNNENVLKKEKLTTRDSRAVERKKYGHKKARRSYQFSKR